MRVPQTFFFSTPTEGGADAQWGQQLVGQIDSAMRELAAAVNGNLGLGDGTNDDNLVGTWLTYNTNGSAGTEDTLTHNLGVIPVGFFLIVPPTSGVINKGSTAWTTSAIYLTCTAASQTATLYVLAPSQRTT